MAQNNEVLSRDNSDRAGQPTVKQLFEMLIVALFWVVL